MTNILVGSMLLHKTKQLTMIKAPAL